MWPFFDGLNRAGEWFGESRPDGCCELLNGLANFGYAFEHGHLLPNIFYRKRSLMMRMGWIFEGTISG
jgi:hypothetical protein